MPGRDIGAGHQQTGGWAYAGGVDGVVVIPAGRRVVGIAAHSTVGGSLSINSGDVVPVPAGSGIEIVPQGNLVAPTITFTATDSYFVESVL